MPGAWKRHYSKERILEFYANQFYVSGNGRGLGVAARYYFDKPVGQLNLLECAFIAGSVKRPRAYNPFIKQNEEKEKKARELARERASYVIRQMYQLGMISQGNMPKRSTSRCRSKRGPCRTVSTPSWIR